MFDVERFRKNLDTSWLGKTFWFFKTIDSTNNHIKSQDSTQTPHGLVCLADYQTAGRGQYDRKWFSSQAKNLMYSIVLKPQQKERLYVLSLISAFSICEVFEKYVPGPFAIKWPNDIYFGGKKLGGVLTETVFEGNTLERLIIGMGLNINEENFGEGISGSATSLFQLSSGKSYDRETLLNNILKKIEEGFEHWEKDDRDMIKQINSRIIGYGRDVRLNIDGKSDHKLYKLLGINHEGHLMALSHDLEVLTFKYEQIRVEDVT